MALVTGFEVDLPTLGRYAAGWDQRAQRMSQLMQQVQDTELSREAFGYIPGIGARVFAAYSGLVEDSMLCLTSASDSLSEIGDALRVVAATYESTDSAAAKDYAALAEWVLAVDGAGAR